MLEHLLDKPVGIFLIVISVILIAPMLSQLLRLPRIIGLILGGIAVGPYGLGLLQREGAIELLATIGLIYLMFSAGAEIDLVQFSKVRKRSLFFGILTFIIPQVLGIIVGFALGYGWLSSVLLGSIFASHTLISYPIVSQLGIANNEAVAVTVGATIITDILALLILAMVSGISDGNITFFFFVRIIGYLTIYTVGILFLVPRIGRFFFKHFRTNTVEFQFVLVVIFIAAFMAEVIGMEAIVGAFLAGLALNSTIPHHSPIMGRVLFIGESFFVPIFLISIGLLVNPTAFFAGSQTIIVSIALVSTVLFTKYLASRITAWRFGYSMNEVQVMWGLSMAQAAATLAATLIGVELNLLNEATFNGVITMILVTCFLSPILIERYGSRLSVLGIAEQEKIETDSASIPIFNRILVPVANPNTEDYLLELGSILSNLNNGLLMPLNIALLKDGHVEGISHQHQLLDPIVASNSDERIQAIYRVDSSISNGILSATVQYDASSVIMGWSGENTFRKAIFGRMLDEVIWNSHVPILVGRLTASISSKQGVILVISQNSLSAQLVKDAIDTAIIIAVAIKVPLKVLTTSTLADMVLQQKELIAHDFSIEALDSNLLREVAERVNPLDLVIIATFGSQRRFQSSLGTIPEELATLTPASLIVIRFPNE